MKQRHFKLLFIMLVIGMTSLLFGQTVTVDLGSGDDTNTTTGAAPFNIFYRSLRSQSVYTAAELNAIGFTGPATLQEIGYYVTGAPLYEMPNFIIRIKHTTATDASAHDDGPFTTVYTNPLLMPTEGDWFMMPFTENFDWNGTDNILIDTAFGIVDPTYNSSGQQKTYPAASGMRYGRSDSVDQTDVATTATAVYKPQIRMIFDGGFFTQHDMTATHIVGPTSPSVNTNAQYTITVANLGMVTQNDYTVKLMKEGGVELNSIQATVNLEQGESADFTLDWTPDVEGPTYLYGQVVLAGDENPANDTTPNLNVTVMPADVLVATIGTGTDTNTGTQAAPINIYYRSNRTQTVYTVAELNAAGVGGMNNLMSLAYYIESPPIHPLPNFRIRVRHTDATDASAHIDGPFEEVYNNPSYLPTAGDWETLAFSIPFAWNGTENILVDTTFDQVPAYNSSGQQRIFTSPNGMRFVRSDSSNQGDVNTTTTANYKPQVQLAFQPLGDTGSLSGNVYDIDSNDPLNGVLIEIAGMPFTQTTNAQGYFSFPFVQIGTQTITASRHGYNNYVTDVTIIEDENTHVNINMELLDNVTVSGQVVGSDFPTVGLVGVPVYLSGYADYDAVTGANGMFSIANVFTNQTYDITVVPEGYTTYSGQVTVGTTDLDVGVIIVDEIAYPPTNVVAVQSADDTYVDLTWGSPVAVDDNFFDFENDDGGWEPTATWDPVGDWEWTDDYNVDNWTNTGSAAATPPPNAVSGTGLWGTVINTNHTNSGGFSYLTKTFDFTTFNDATMIFWSWNDSFGNFDYGQVSVNGNIVWGPAWNYTNTAWEEVVLDLSAYDGLSDVEIRFEHYATTVVNYAGWYIDDVYVGPEPQNRGSDSFAGQLLPQTGLQANTFASNNDRVLEGFRVYRFLFEDVNNEDNWVELGTVTDTTYTDNGWDDVASGFYRYGVKSVHTNDVISSAAISNWVGKDMTTNVTVNITTNDGSSAAGAEVTLTCLDEDPEGNSPVYTQIAAGTVPAVATFNNVMLGDYNMQVTLQGFESYTENNIEILDTTVLDVQINEILFPPSNVVAEINQDTNNADLIWNASGGGALTEFRYDDGVSTGQLGSTGGTNTTVLGAAHRRDAEIHEVSWMTTAEGGPHNTVNLFIFGLTAAGMPNGSDILYQSMNVPNIDLEWNVYELPDPVEAPNGFLVGLSYAGFLGLATDDGIGDPWEFVPNTQFFTGDYTGNVWSAIEEFDFNVSYLLRAYGYDYGEITRSADYVSTKQTSNIARTTRDRVELSAGNTARILQTDAPVYNSARNSALTRLGVIDRAVRDDRAIEGFVVYRFLSQNQDNENLWSELSTITTPDDTTYTDTEWSTLDPGVYMYAVKAVYTGNTLSTPAFSNTLENSMSAMVTINLTTNSGDSVTGAVVTLTNNDMDPNHVYTMTAPASGILVFPNVWHGTYMIEAHLAGFDEHIEHNVEIMSDTFMHNVELIESLHPVVELTYEVVDNNVTLDWYAPGTTFGEYWDVDFEDNQLPDGWVSSGVNTDTSGPLPGFWTVNDHSSADYSPIGQYHAGLWWSYNNQDEWLKSPEFNCPPEAELVYWTVGYRGSTNADHYYVKVSNDGGSTWTVLQDLSAMTGAWNYYATPMTVSLAAYSGQDIMIAWNAVDGPTNDGLWYVWFVDDISIADITFRATDLVRESKGIVQPTRNTRAVNERESQRALLGYKVMRDDVVLVEELSETTFTDSNVPGGTYVYSVIAQYTTGESDELQTDQITIISTDEDIIVTPQVTELRGNYPNPFNPETKINFSLKDDDFVVIEIFNVKGQMVRTLVNEEMRAGNHSIVWNGRNNNNREAGSGIFFYRMKAGTYSSTRKMILMK
jgi:hypothetical protein